jgi:hypothetical protein
MRRRLGMILVIGAAAVVAAVALWQRSRTKTETVAPPPATRTENVDHTSAAQVKANALRIQHPAQALPAQKALSAPVTSATGLERVRAVVSRDNTLSHRERVDALTAIQTPLTHPEVEALCQYLLTPARDEPKPHLEVWLRNEIMDRLVEVETLPPGVADVLIAVYRDPAQDIVSRDYAVQHMAPAHERATAGDQRKLQATLWQATGETDSSIAGTALLALLYASANSPSIDQEQIARTALRLATDGRCGELARITAVQVCGRLRAEQALPVVQQLAETAESIPLRIAATAALGDYASKSAMATLTRLAVTSDARQSAAVQAALHRVTRTQKALEKQTTR